MLAGPARRTEIATSALMASGKIQVALFSIMLTLINRSRVIVSMLAVHITVFACG